jgi:Bacterial extracellular solute-binding protein
VAIAVGISAILMITITARAVISRATCSNQPTVINIAVSYDVAPAVQAVARAFNSTNHSAGGHCVEVQITEGDSAAEAGHIDGQAAVPGATPIDAWIPDSSLWVDVARSYPIGAQIVQPTGMSVARSPLMIVTTEAIADQTHIFDSAAGWNVLLPPAYGGPPAVFRLATDLPDPVNTSTGLATLVQVSRDLGVSPAARAAFTKFAYGATVTQNFDSVSGLQTFVAATRLPFARRGVTVASEQAVIAYDRATAGSPLAARYPTSAFSALGSPELDYPYVLTTSAAVPLAAAQDFGKYLKTAYAAAEVRYYGFRSASGVPDVMPSSSRLSALPLELASAPGASEVATNLQVWEKLGLGSRDLALVDVSPAMNQPSGNGTQTLEQEMNQTSALGIPLFPDSTQMGTWEMGQSQSVAEPYKQMVPLGPLPADLGLINRRAQLVELSNTLTTSKGRLALHDAILAGYEYLTKTYVPNYSNAELVLTAGVDSAPGDMPLNALLSKLRALFNPSRKVEIVVIQFGKRGDFSALTKIADAAGGVAYRINSPTDVGRIFIKAISHRLCVQGCLIP